MTTTTNNDTPSRTRITETSFSSKRYSQRSSSLLRYAIVFCMTCMTLMNGNGCDRSSFLVLAENLPGGAGNAAKGDRSLQGGNKPAAAGGPEPPAGLFERLDVNHDSMLSESEYKAGWPLIAQEFYTSWLPANNGGFMKGFTSGVAMILATEIGDKTFFIAAILSMRQQRSAVFVGAVLSLYVMTVLSSIMGLVLPKLVPVKYTHILGGLLFLYFGFKLLFDSRGMDSTQVSDELEEVEEELKHSKKDDGDEESQATNSSNSMRKGFSQIAMQSFTLTFLADWGDRSQIATIALSAAKNPYGVTLGGCIGHTMCTGMAVLGGRMLAARISEKTVSIFGGIIFLVFGIHSVFFEV
jgi:putative Ca2+/H+ antiporter (TMEM165/GDT1 family)